MASIVQQDTQLSQEDIQAYSKLASEQQIIRKFKIADQDIILSAMDDYPLDPQASAGLSISLFAEQVTLPGALKAKNTAISTDVIQLQTGAGLVTVGENGQPIPGVAMESNGQPGNGGQPGGYIYLYVNSFSPKAKPIEIDSHGGTGGAGQDSQTDIGGPGGNGGEGGKVVLLYSNVYLTALAYLQQITNNAKKILTSGGHDASSVVAEFQSFSDIFKGLYPTPADRQKVIMPDSTTLEEGLQKLGHMVDTQTFGKNGALSGAFFSLVMDFDTVLKSLRDDFETQYLRRKFNATGGDKGLGGRGDGGSKNGTNGKKGADGEVIIHGFQSSVDLFGHELTDPFYKLPQPFLFLHPNQLQMVLEKARRQVLFSDPTTPAGLAAIKGAKDLLNRLAFKTGFFSQDRSSTQVAKLYKKHQATIGSQNSIEIFTHVFNGAIQLSNQLTAGQDAYGHSYNYAPRGTYQMYKAGLDEMIGSFTEIETAYLKYSSDLHAQKAKLSYLTEQTSKLNSIQSQSQQNIAVLNADLKQSADLIESYSAQFASHQYKIQDAISTLTEAVKDYFSFDVKAFLGSLTSIAFAPESALMWGTQAASMLYSGMTELKNDQGVTVQKDYLVHGIKQISGTIDEQMLAESFQQLNSGVIAVDDPGGNKILTDEAQLMKLLNQFYSKFPSEIDDVKKEFQAYIALIQKRNSEVLQYNQILTRIEKELIAYDKARLIVTNINQNRFDTVDPALPEIASYMEFIYNHAKSDLLEQLYRTSRAFDFWSVTKTNILANSLNGMTPEKVDSYLLQSINEQLEANFQRSPGTFSSPKGSFSDDEALKIELSSFQLGLLKFSGSTTVTIKPPTKGAFFGRANIRLSSVTVTMEMEATPTVNTHVLIDVVQTGKDKIQNPSSSEWYDYEHNPVVVQCGFDIKSGVAHPASLVSQRPVNQQALQLADIGPFSDWRIEINSQKNPGFNIKKIKSVTIAFDGTFYDTIV